MFKTWSSHRYSVLPLLAAATAAIESTLLNGDEDLMVPERYAMPAVCTLPSWKGSDSSKRDRSAQNPKKLADLETHLR